MDSRTVKQFSYVSFGLGVASVIGSAAIYLLGQRGKTEGRKNTSVFVGLWAPTLFAISEMLDRISEEDHTYMGVPIERERDREREREGVLAEAARTLIKR